MNDNTPVPGYAFQAGRILAGLHYKIVPIGPGKKYPPIQAWQDAATDDLVQVAQWLAETNYGIGWAMGLQPNGKHLFCLDIDGDLGVASLAELVNKRGGEEAFTVTCQQQTGSGGWHYIFESEFEVRNSASQFAPGIDIRGEGGQIVVGPTIHPNGQAYRWVKGPKRNPPQLAPAWIMERIAAQNVPAPQVPSLATVPVAALNGQHADDGETPFEWLNRTFDPEASLLRLGWTATGRAKGNEWQFTRPGKDPRQGTSATWHVDTGVVNVFSTSVDTIYHTVGKAGNGCITLTPADLWMVENHVTDRSEASRMIRRLMPQEAGASAYKAPAVPVQGGTVQPDTAPGLNLPDEFWEARGYLTHIRDAAWSMSCSPDAVFAAVMARYSANLHPSIMLPQWGTLDLFVVIAAHSGGYKSKASKTASHLWPGPGYKDVMMDRQVGSGQAIPESFFEYRDEDGAPCSPSKKGAVKVQVKWGLHISTDETTALTTAASQSGSIIIQTMCQAWMGEAIGQMLADPTKSRMIEPHKVRVSAELKIQTVHGYKLFAEEFASTGLAQRMVCFPALDPTIHERYLAGTAKPDWPGELDLPLPFLIMNGAEPRIMELAPAIAAHFDAVGAEGHNPTAVFDPLDTHADLSRLKIAAIFALWENRFSVSDNDWELAGQVINSHRTVRTMLKNTKLSSLAQAKSDERHALVEKEVEIDEGKHKALLRSTVAAIQARIVAEKPLGKKYMSKQQRDVYEEAMVLLEAQGMVTELLDGGWSKA